MTVAKCSLTSCRWVCFPTGSHTMPGQQQSAHTDFVGSRVYACLGVTCHLHFWQNDQGLLCANVVTRRWNGHWIRVNTQKLTLEKKILLPLLPGFKLATFWSCVRRLYQQAILVPIVQYNKLTNGVLQCHLLFLVCVFVDLWDRQTHTHALHTPKQKDSKVSCT